MTDHIFVTVALLRVLFVHVYNSRNLPLATAGEKVGRSRHQILQILPLLVDLCEGWAATWEGLIKI